MKSRRSIGNTSKGTGDTAGASFPRSSGIARAQTLGERSLGLSYSPAIDTLRTFAMAAVVIYHASFLQVIRGAGFAVSMFFTLSGFLMTSILAKEFESTSTVKVTSFWVKRFKRLLPATVAALWVVIAYGATVASPEQLQRFRADALSALFYVANLRFMFVGQSYVDRNSQPSPVLTFWSLSLEEQFYLVLPWLVLGAALLVGRSVRSRARWLIISGWALSLALVATAWMAFRSQTPGASDSLYFSPVTRSAEFLVGVSLAAYRAANRGFPAQIGRLCTRLAPAALIVMGWIWFRVDVAGPFAYQGGFLLHAILTAIVLIAALTPSGFSRLLGWGPLAYTGRFSYGMYVYHWPILLFLTDQTLHLKGAPAIAVRFLAVIPLAVVSYFLIERPFRYGAPSRMAALPLVAIAAVGLTAFGIVRVSTNPPEPTLKLDRVETKVSEADATLTVLVEGDSQANNIARGLAESAPPNVRLIDRTRPGCGLALGERRTEARWVPDDPRCSPPWPTQFAADVEAAKPDVVIALFGSQDTWDRRLNGKVYRFDEDDAAALRESEIRQAARIFTSTGARLLWLSAPTDRWVGWGAVMIEDESRSMNNPEWIERWNSSVRTVLAAEAADASVLDLNAFVTPGNTYSESLNGQVIREVDGLHFTKPGRAMIADWLWPQVPDSGKKSSDS